MLLYSILALVLHVAPSQQIQPAIDRARQVWLDRGEATEIRIQPGTYYEELTIDVPNLTLCNAAARPSTAVYDGGVRADKNAVRISWYYGHGYQYQSMNGVPNYGGKRTRRWNATVLVNAPGFVAKDIIFENSFNLYVSPAELRDSMVDISRSELEWTEKERPKRTMPTRPRTPYSTEVQGRAYNERAAAISFTSQAAHCELTHCRVAGRQDAMYGDHGASVIVSRSVLAGSVDFIFGGMDLTVNRSQLVAMIDEENNNCYIAAGRGAVRQPDWAEQGDSLRTPYGMVPQDELAKTGMVFDHCSVRHATENELAHPGNKPVYLCRPWRWWGKQSFRHTRAAKGVIASDPVSLGLTKGHVAPWVVIK